MCKSKVRYLYTMSELGGKRTKNKFLDRDFVKVNVMETIIIIQIIGATIVRDIKKRWDMPIDGDFNSFNKRSQDIFYEER